MVAHCVRRYFLVGGRGAPGLGGPRGHLRPTTAWECRSPRPAPRGPGKRPLPQPQGSGAASGTTSRALRATGSKCPGDWKNRDWVRPATLRPEALPDPLTGALHRWAHVVCGSRSPRAHPHCTELRVGFAGVTCVDLVRRRVTARPSEARPQPEGHPRRCAPPARTSDDASSIRSTNGSSSAH